MSESPFLCLQSIIQAMEMRGQHQSLIQLGGGAEIPFVNTSLKMQFTRPHDLFTLAALADKQLETHADK